MPEFRIDNYDDSDYDSAMQLIKESGLRGASREEITCIQARGGQFIVARDSENEDVLGTVMWTFDGERAVVRKVAVHPDCRRQGIATAMMEEARRQIKEAGITRALLFTGGDNVKAQKLYEKLDWTLDFSSIQSWKIVP